MSMRGSGIYSYSKTAYLMCESDLYIFENGEDVIVGKCDFEGDVDAWVNDHGTVTAECPECGTVVTISE